MVEWDSYVISGLETVCYSDKLPKLQLDAFGRDREVTFADLERFQYTNACFQEGMRLIPSATYVIGLVSGDDGATP